MSLKGWVVVDEQDSMAVSSIALKFGLISHHQHGTMVPGLAASMQSPSSYHMQLLGARRVSE